jgi:hypothetical protein
MTKYVKYILRAFALAALVAEKLPIYLEDGKITLAEMVDFIERVLEIGGWKAEIVIPDNLLSTEGIFKLKEEE